jgi:hypothetical protein
MKDNLSELDRIINNCVDMIIDGEWTIEECLSQHPDRKEELQPLLQTALRLRRANSVRVSNQFRRESPGRLKLRLQASSRKPVARQQSGSDEPPLSGLRFAVPILVVLVVFIGVTSGITQAANWSKPGDALYQVDRALETFQLNMRSRADDRARLNLQFATERLDEIHELLEKGDVNQIRSTIDDYREEIGATAPVLSQAQGGEEGDTLILSASETLFEHQSSLKDILKKAPSDTQDVIQEAIDEVEILQMSVVVSPPDDEPGQNGTPVPLSTDVDDIIKPLATPTPKPYRTPTKTPNSTMTRLIPEFDRTEFVTATPARTQRLDDDLLELE